MKTHECPAPGCREIIPNRLLACLPHWRQLSPATQAEIYATARMFILSDRRVAALEAALEEWRAL